MIWSVCHCSADGVMRRAGTQGRVEPMFSLMVGIISHYLIFLLIKEDINFIVFFLNNSNNRMFADDR